MCVQPWIFRLWDGSRMMYRNNIKRKKEMGKSPPLNLPGYRLKGFLFLSSSAIVFVCVCVCRKGGYLYVQNLLAYNTQEEV
jgi:hypothetical protein